jgi:hypothetical protein
VNSTEARLIQAQRTSTTSSHVEYTDSTCFLLYPPSSTPRQSDRHGKMSYYLAIVSPLDIPLYEIQFQSQSTSSSTPTNNGFPSWSSFTTPSGGDLNEEKPPVQGQGQGINTHGPGIERHLAQMIAFASLDSVDELLEGTGNLYVIS